MQNRREAKGILVDSRKCDGCRRCELMCSRKHFGLFAPAFSRIRILSVDDSFFPSLCQACADAPCLKVCPVNARVRQESNAVDTEEELCLGCLACLYACPFNAPVLSPATKKTITCDLCADDPAGPWCVQACRRQGALQFLPLTAASRRRAQAAALPWRGVIYRGRGLGPVRLHKGADHDGAGETEGREN